MILYRLKCKKGHEFEAWFASSAAFDTQEKRGHAVLRALRHVEGGEGADGAAHRQAGQVEGCREKGED